MTIFGYQVTDCSATTITSSRIMDWHPHPTGDLVKEGVLPLHKHAVGIFYSPCRQGSYLKKGITFYEFSFSGPKLKVVSTMSVGYEHIDVKECEKRNIIACNLSKVSTGCVSEFTIALALAVSRRIFEGKGTPFLSWSYLYFPLVLY